MFFFLVYITLDQQIDALMVFWFSYITLEAALQLIKIKFADFIKIKIKIADIIKIKIKIADFIKIKIKIADFIKKIRLQTS